MSSPNKKPAKLRCCLCVAYFAPSVAANRGKVCIPTFKSGCLFIKEDGKHE